MVESSVIGYRRCALRRVEYNCVIILNSYRKKNILYKPHIESDSTMRIIFSPTKHLLSFQNIVSHSIIHHKNIE